jgi:hypothetical protein
MYAIELNDWIKSFECSCCGEQSMTVWGWVSKDGVAHAVYFVGLMTGHTQPSVRLSLSIGGWGVDHPDENHVEGRNWVYIEARPTATSYEMMVREPEESFYFGKGLLGQPISRTDALARREIDEFFAVADHIAFNDPAVMSYLFGQNVSSEGRQGFH